MKTKGWIFVIDTDEYAGNFEREMTAYITGCVGDCGVGEEMKKLYEKEFGVNEYEDSIFSDLLEHRPNEYGCCRPCSMWPDQSGKFNSVGIFFIKKPKSKIIELMKKRANKFAEVKRTKSDNSWDKNFKLEILGFRLIQELYDTQEQIV